MGSAHWKLPGYTIEEFLGAGASSQVWRARVNVSGDRVALKRVLLHDAGSLRAARQEAAMLSTLDHPHLVRLHELVPTDDAVVLVLDLADGGSLAELIGQRGRLSSGEVVSALAPIGAALAYAHAHGIVHGDLTPANILFTREGRPLLADLGVARIVGDDTAVSGTPAYLDPVIARGGTPTASSDVFMLGAVAVHALSGRPVWNGDDAVTVLAEAASGHFDALADRLASLPPALGDLLRRALAFAPERRVTAAEFALDLRHAAEPSVIELTAGRRALDRQPGRGRAVPYTGIHRSGGAPRAVPARPPFERPAMESSTGPSAPLTHTIRAALRPSLPPTGRRALAARIHRRMGAVRAYRRGIGAAAVGAALLAVLLAGAAWWHVPSGATATNRTAGTVSAAPLADPSTSRTASADSPAHVLAALDAVRAQAFERNQPALLAQVYVPGPLLEQDTALLARVVGPGCALVGVHTTYAVRQVVAISSERLVVRVRASLGPSTRKCGHGPSTASSGVGPTSLRIELVRAGDGYRIASQQVVT